MVFIIFCMKSLVRISISFMIGVIRDRNSSNVYKGSVHPLIIRYIRPIQCVVHKLQLIGLSSKSWYGFFDFHTHFHNQRLSVSMNPDRSTTITTHIAISNNTNDGSMYLILQCFVCFLHYFEYMIDNIILNPGNLLENRAVAATQQFRYFTR